jgi:hypothetical protein
MDINKFKSSFAKIEFLESANAFGHHPFQLFVVTSDDKNEINALVGLKISDIIARVKQYISSGAKNIFLSMDLPKSSDIPEDFVFVLHIPNGEKAETIVVEYNPETGDIIQESDGSQYSLTNTLTDYFLNAA